MEQVEIIRVNYIVMLEGKSALKENKLKSSANKSHLKSASSSVLSCKTHNHVNTCDTCVLLRILFIPVTF